MKSCQVYTTKKHIFILCLHGIPAGTWRVLDPMVKLERLGVSITSIGEAVNKILAASSSLVVAPDFDTANTAMLLFLGFKSWGKFADAVEFSCFVDLDQDNVKITPTFRDGRGFSCDADKSLTCEPVAGLIGEAVFNVLHLA